MDSPALAAAKAWARGRPDVTAVYEGLKYRDGKPTGEVGIVVVVKQKRPAAMLAERDLVPKAFDAQPTDVQEGTFKALGLTARRRPCEAGWSIGHVQITAGTFGAAVQRGASSDWLILTNNHVGAASNDARIGDFILQPGKADQGREPGDRIATLLEFVTINWKGAAKPPKKRSAVARAWWSTIKATGNLGAWLARCPFRVTVAPRAVDQPAVNLVDAAVCRPLESSMIDPQVYGIGVLKGVKDLQLGERVQKVGRTTGHTYGVVEGVSGSAEVSYGDGKVAQFDDQVIIRGADGREFSAGGDSGSAIVTADGYLGGLLYAGGGGITLANKISHVLGLLGVRVP